MTRTEPRHGEIWQFRVKGELAYVVGFVVSGLMPNKQEWAREVRVDRAGNPVKLSQCLLKKYYTPDKKIGDWLFEPTALQGRMRN